MAATSPAPAPAEQGTLFVFGAADKQGERCAFQYSVSHPSMLRQGYHAILLPGLGDGLLRLPYARALSNVLLSFGYTLNELVLRSMFNRFGQASLQSDVDDIDDLIDSFAAAMDEKANDDLRIILVGHSTHAHSFDGTGCQDIVRYLRVGRHRARVRLAVLQAPVADRDFNDTLPNAVEQVALATEMMHNGQGGEMMPLPTTYGMVPITASRYHALCAAGGDEDFFSLHLSDQQLNEAFQHMTSCDTLWVFSLKDQYDAAFGWYYPDGTDVEAHAKRMLAAAPPHASMHLIPDANHSLIGQESQFIQCVQAFIASREQPVKQPRSKSRRKVVATGATQPDQQSEEDSELSAKLAAALPAGLSGNAEFLASLRSELKEAIDEEKQRLGVE